MKSRPCFHLSAGVVAVLFACLAPSPLRAVDRIWSNASGGDFSTPANWSTGIVPVAADIANFTLNNTYTVGFIGNVTNTALHIENGNVTLVPGGLTYTLTSNAAVEVGNVAGQTGRLTVKDGILGVNTSGDDVTIGTEVGSTGFLTVTTDGILGTAALPPNLVVGSSGTGTLTVNDNGRIDARNLVAGGSPGITGTATITGPNAVMDLSGSITRIGSSGTGFVNVTNGGTLTSALSVFVGDALGADGTVTVSGAGSSWAQGGGFTDIGIDGDGTLTISSGGLVSTDSIVILGSSATGFGTATVTGAGSRWKHTGGAQNIGSIGQGVLNVSSGGEVTASAHAVLGSADDSEGRVTVTGAGSQWTLGSTLTVGQSGTGDFTVSAGGEVSATFVNLGSAAPGSGVATITGAGSKLMTTGGVTVANLGSGTLHVASGAEVYVGTFLNVNDPAGGPIGRLRLDGGSIFVAGDFTNASVFTFTFTDGLLQVKGNFQPSTAAAPLTLNGTDNRNLPTLDLIGSGTTTNVTALTVGNNRRGQLLLRQGRVLNLGNNTVGIGASVGGEGTISVQSGAQLVTTGFLEIGGTLGGIAAGTGTLNIAGGTVDVGQLELFRDGTINLSSGTLAVNALPVHDGQFNWTGGTLRFGAAFSLTSTNVPVLLGLDATLGPGQALSSAAGQAVTLQTPLIVDGGSLSASTLINQSRIEVRSGVVGAVQNDALIVGDGTIAGAVTNGATGTIRVDTGKSLYFTGAIAPNAGELNLQGGTLDFTSAVTNSTTGRINGRGTIDFNGGLTNAGKMLFSGGPTDIYGNVTFTGGAGGGEMINSGGANVVTFYGNVTHNGDEIRTSPTNTTVFFGNVTGAGPFTGTGAVRFEGTFTPGNSPAIVPVEGDLQFGADSRLVMELGGTTAGDEYDRLQIGGLLSLDGALDVTLLNGFSPRYGDTFDLLDFGALAGRFGSIDLPSLTAGMAWDTSALYSTGAITAVPEPSTWLLAVMAGGILMHARRRRTQNSH